MRADRHGERAEKGHFHSILEVQLLNNSTGGVQKYSYAEYHDCETHILHAQRRHVIFLPTLALSGARYSSPRYSVRCGISFAICYSNKSRGRQKKEKETDVHIHPKPSQPAYFFFLSKTPLQDLAFLDCSGILICEKKCFFKPDFRANEVSALLIA